jgi:hypothetical protein
VSYIIQFPLSTLTTYSVTRPGDAMGFAMLGSLNPTDGVQVNVGTMESTQTVKLVFGLLVLVVSVAV